MEGRGFTLRELKTAIVAASGSRLTSFYLSCWELYVWELVEAVELVVDLRAESDESSRLWENIFNPQVP